MKKKALLFLAGCISLSLLTGCGVGSSGDDNEVYLENTQASAVDGTELTFFGFKTDAMNLTAIESALQGYMDENPSVRISYEGVKSADYWDVLDLRIEQDNLDNVFMVHHDDVVDLRKKGELADLSGLSTIANFSDMAKSQFTEEDGSVYFLPTQISTFNLYINTDFLKKHHMNIPTKWSEFEKVCDYFVSRDIVPIVGNNFTTCRSLIAAKSLYPVYQMDDPEAMIKKFNTGEEDIMDYLSQGIEMLGEMFDKGWFDQDEMLETNPTSDDLELFAKGERPFMITGGWASQRLAALEPGFEYGIYPFPILEDGSVLVMNVDTCISVAAQDDNLEITKDFVEYFTQPEVINEYCDTQSSYAPLAQEHTPSDKTIEPSSDYLFNGESVIGSDYRLDLPLDNAENEVGQDMIEGMGTEEAIDKMAELIHQ